jgi:HK97 family phage major capsid protein
VATIVPIPEAVLDDASFDVWGSVRPLLEQAAGRAIDAAIFFGTNIPASWPTNIAAAASAAGNTYNRGTNAAAVGGIAEDINQTMALVEADGYAVDGFVTRTTYKARLRSARDTSGQKLMDIGNGTIEGAPVKYVMPGLWPTGSGSAELFAGDWTQQIMGVRQDFTYKILDQAVIQDNTGAIIYNLAQQDMVALRLVIRVAWQTANPINYEQGVEASRYPVAVLRAP